ncbi:MAG TPA: choice-of-anchor R domain-containing protein [Bryobacteraceae bacterium]|nr:choice-of-anchor R domain-containing protein [Bryobacteraceae bacterium]
MGTTQRFAVLLALVSAACVAPASADVVYTNFGAGDSYDTGNAYGLNQTTGESFTPGANYEFTDVVLPMAEFNGTTSADVYLESDSTGVPGTILDTLVQQSQITNSRSFITFDASPSCATCTLTAGTKYWIVAAGNSGVYWFENNQGDKGVATYNSSSWSYNSNGTSAAFQVDGTPLTSAVPEPQYLPLLGAAFLAGVFLRRKRAGSPIQ